MSKIYPSELLKKLSEKIGKSEKYVREQITKRARGRSPEAYFVFWLNEEGIKSTLYQRQLSDSIRGEIQAMFNSEALKGAKPGSPKGKIINNVEKQLSLSKLTISPKSPFIPQDIIKEAYDNAVIYQVLYIFENSVRKFIIKVLSDKYGENWWNSNNVINTEIKSKVVTRLRDEKINSFHGKRGVHEIFYTDFSELATIVKNNANVFNKYFLGVKGKTSFLVQRLEELSISRNTIAHTCPLKRTDRDRFINYFTDWYKQIDGIVGLFNGD